MNPAFLPRALTAGLLALVAWLAPVRAQTLDKVSFGTNWVVTGGLQPGDKVITQGTNNLRSGAPIRPVPAKARQRVEPRQAGTGRGQGRQGG